MVDSPQVAHTPGLCRLGSARSSQSLGPTQPRDGKQALSAQARTLGRPASGCHQVALLSVPIGGPVKGAVGKNWTVGPAGNPKWRLAVRIKSSQGVITYLGRYWPALEGHSPQQNMSNLGSAETRRRGLSTLLPVPLTPAGLRTVGGKQSNTTYVVRPKPQVGRCVKM